MIGTASTPHMYKHIQAAVNCSCELLALCVLLFNLYVERNVFKLVTALQLRQLYHTCAPNDFTANLIDKLGTGSKCAPGGNQVIYEQDTLALLDVALAHLNSVCAILQLIIRRDCLTWQLSRFAQKDKRAVQA